MRSPQLVLENLQRHSLDKNYRYERLYRNLYNPDFYLLAYQNIYANKGAMTPGIDGLTLDGYGMERVNQVIESLRNHSYRPNPARRRYIPKQNNPSKKRPLGIPSANDKLVQEIVRMILESIYEPTFSTCSHGFRPKRSCHTALLQIQHNFTAVKWFVEGDIKAYFDTIDHHILIGILRRRIADEALIELLWKFLKAGYLEDWQYNATFSGTPQGSGISPILANIYLNELDMYMEEYKKGFERGEIRGHYNEYARRRSTYQRFVLKCKQNWQTMSAEEKKAALTEQKRLRKEYQQFPGLNPMDDGYRRIQYVRYADDFLVGVIGSKADAEGVKADISRFLSDKLKLTMSAEKTLVTHGHDKARFLGYDVTVNDDNSTRKTSKGQTRIYMNRVKLYLPREKWIGKLLDYGVLKISRGENGGEKWKPLQRDDYMYLAPHEIVMQYNAQIRGIYNYYRLASNVSVLSKFRYVMEYSMYKTLAGKYQITMTKAKLKYTKGGAFSVPYQNKSGEKTVTFYDEGFRRVKFAMGSFVDQTPEYAKLNKPGELFFRYKAGKCELCGIKSKDVTVHQVGTLKVLTGQTEWERVMLKKRRKTLIVCRDCHANIHTPVD
ncbi:MAG: group II intron reverse transcriptase/maturase [Peptococcaceae bacterium]|jgi:group II intron reverse transcriptase/maturase|nr:group II intron reverse transcriptase/maturase [Peptococcaceae bacterium]